MVCGRATVDLSIGKTGRAGSGSSIWRMPLDPTGPRELVAGGRFRLTYPSLSPDDCWLAYISDETGRPEAFVRPLAGGVGVQVSTAGADYVRWSRRGDELFFSNGTMILAAGVSTTPTVRVGAPAILLRGFPVSGLALECSVSPDAKRFCVHGECPGRDDGQP